MKIAYLLLASGAWGLCCAVFNIYRALREGLGTSNYRDFPPDEAAAGVRNRQPRPGGTGEAQARPEVEGSPYSVVP